MKINSLEERLVEQIIRIILTYKEPEKIIIFGSRADGSFKKASDIDIAIFGHNWTDRDINIVKNELEESVKTPLKFDVLNFYDISKEKLRENIIKNGIVIYESRKS